MGRGTYSEGSGRLFVALIRIVMGRSGRVTEAPTERRSGLGRVRTVSLGSVRYCTTRGFAHKELDSS